MNKINAQHRKKKEFFHYRGKRKVLSDKNNPNSFKRIFLRKLIPRLAFVLSFILSAFIFSHIDLPGYVIITPQERTPGHVHTSKTYVEKEISRLENTENCWGNGTIDPPPPSKVIYSPPKKSPSEKIEVKIGGPEMTDKALQQIFSEKDHKLTVYKFCQ